MKKFARNSLALATLAVMATGFVGVAQAGTVAYSNLNIENLRFGDGTLGNVFTEVTHINVFNLANSTTNTADLASVGGVDSNTDLNNQACQGACGGVPDFDERMPIGSDHFARALSTRSGSILTADGATAKTVAETSLTKNDTGIANSNIQLNAGFDFVLGQASKVGFTMNTSGGLHAKQDADNNVPPSSAQANVDFTITIRQGTTVVFRWTPDGLDGNEQFADDDDQDNVNLNDALAAPFAGQDLAVSLAGTWFASSKATLLQDTLYTLAINHTSDVNATKEIPEPGSLALLGLGLLGLGARKFRRS